MAARKKIPGKKTKLNGKVSDLKERICSILDIPLSSISLESFICNDRCYRQVKRFEKLQEDVKTLHRSLKEMFATNTRTKRGVPSDSAISPSVSAPAKALRHTAVDEGRVKAAKSLSFREILPKPNPEVFIPVPSPIVQPVLPLQVLNVTGNYISDDHCEGDICTVQVIELNCLRLVTHNRIHADLHCKPFATFHFDKISMLKFFFNISGNCDLRVREENRRIAKGSPSAWKSFGAGEQFQSNRRCGDGLSRS